MTTQAYEIFYVNDMYNLPLIRCILTIYISVAQEFEQW